MSKVEDMDIDKGFKEYVFDKASFKYFCSLYRIGKEDFVRKSKIRQLVYSIMNNDFTYSDKQEKFVLEKNQNENGRNWILQYLSNFDYANIDNELILNLDAARGVLKILDNKDMDLIWGRLNRVL